jgi:hypothetical protein
MQHHPTMPINWESRAVYATDIVSVVRNGTNVFFHDPCATPTPLIDALCRAGTSPTCDSTICTLPQARTFPTRIAA